MVGEFGLMVVLAIPEVTGEPQEQEPGVLILRGNRNLMLDLY
jgi:hypothetical protein